MSYISIIYISVEIDLKGNDLTLSGGGLPGNYKAQQFHFHWGSEDKRGSEHNINGLQYPMEVNLHQHQMDTFQRTQFHSGYLQIPSSLYI